ncbi:MAG TPA: type II toxin-antitoxin system RelE/ParE family toxin, partial [Candidatus Limnocylindria bacterium]|nr:type II toxin-antitoxin system RelE/ParE family toxin [Candidatus Limnocylindria bacterium]
HTEADAEHARTIAWLTEHVSAHHATSYATAISSALDEILERPLAWPQWKSRPDVRVRHLRDIPYSIVYQVRDRVVTVAAFAHMHRAPGYWLERVK